MTTVATVATVTTAQRNALLNILRIKIAKIGKVEGRYIDRSEESARAYAEALADANIITDDERDELYEQAKVAAEARVREVREAEHNAFVAHRVSLDIELQSALKHQ